MSNLLQSKPTRKFGIAGDFKWTIFGLIGLFIALSAWAVASPVGSSPDDDFHLASIWCGVGDRPGLCEPGLTSETKKIPVALAQSICFAYNPDANASCQSGNLAITPELFFETDRINTSGLYPPLFFSVMSLFASDHLQISVITMRMFNIFVFLGLLTLTCFLVSPNIKRALLTTYAITIIPLGFFLIPSTNPSSWTVSGIGVLFFAVNAIGKTPSRKRQLALGFTAIIAFALVAGSRGDGALYSILAIAAALFVQPKNQFNSKWIYLSASVLVLFAAFIFFSTGQSSVANEGLIGSSDAVSQLSGLNLLLSNVLNFPSLIVGIYGSWGLGWLDTVMPPVVWVFGLLVAGTFIILGFANTNLKKNLVAFLVLFALCIIPLYVLYKSNAAVGAYVQPRYLLPLIILLVSISQLPIDKSYKNSLNSTQSIIVISALSIAFSVSLHLNMDRYITGMSQPTWNLDFSEGWWWNVSVSPFAIWAMGSLGMSFFLVFVFNKLIKEENKPSIKTDVFTLTEKSL
jgi:hypothetical protein